MKVRNTSVIALRAAYLHGPYTLYAACYSSRFNPNHEDTVLETHGVPDFEPNLKAGGSWLSQLTVPENIRETADKANVKRTIDGRAPSCTWIIEVSSQVIFSTSATVHYDILMARDEKSLELAFSAITPHISVTPGQLQDHQVKRKEKNDSSDAYVTGVYSKTVTLVVEDTESLWNKPNLPGWNDEGKDRGQATKSDGDIGIGDLHQAEAQTGRESPSHAPASRRPKKVHLVVLTHGLHSNIGADMLYIKESIDATAEKARVDARKRKRKDPSIPRFSQSNEPLRDAQMDQMNLAYTTPSSDVQNETGSEDEDEEQVIVRGFSGNAVRTERGIQYLGKRLAKYVLSMTYPDQPFLPVKKSTGKSRTKKLAEKQAEGAKNSTAATTSLTGQPSPGSSNPAYKITSISFIAHSLGGLTQTYAVAYIQKHSPQFFDKIKPINFVAMATPFLGLSNENPIYVKFALDFGLVGRTGQDLGLAWRAPAMVRSGWAAMIGGIGTESQRALKQISPGSKPLLRILPAGPAHEVLKLFRNRTIYSNVVNDGIVPLRTSCLLFLDWSGLDRVEKARRENGIVGTMAGWGWAELTGANSSSHRQTPEKRAEETHHLPDKPDEYDEVHSNNNSDQGEVPQPFESLIESKMGIEGERGSEIHQGSYSQPNESRDVKVNTIKAQNTSPAHANNPFGSLLHLFRPSQSISRRQSPKQSKIYSRSQTLQPDSADGTSHSSESVSEVDSLTTSRLPAKDEPSNDHKLPFEPPRTSIFESASDILNPPLPSKEFIHHTQSRPRTIFHDRIYHPEDIPPPRIKKRSGLKRNFSSESKNFSSDTDLSNFQGANSSSSGMKVEEKIARAYHRDLSWRKVLVRLEPDAHNNICVRRMFSNAYGWPVVNHLVDTHFADNWTANTADSDEPNDERARPMEEGVGLHGEEVHMQPKLAEFKRTDSEVREAKDDVPGLSSVGDSSMRSNTGRPRLSHHDSAQWDDMFFEETDDDSEVENAEFRRSLEIPASQLTADEDPGQRAPKVNIKDFLVASTSGERNSPAKVVQQKLDKGELVASPEPADQNEEENIVIRGHTTSLGLGKSVEEQLGKIAGVRKHVKEIEEGRGNGSE